MEQSEFWASGSMGGAAARIAEELSNREKEPPPHRNLEVSEALRKSRKIQSKHLNMNKLCVPRGTIGVLGFGKYERAAARIAEKLSNREKEPPPHRKLEVSVNYPSKQRY